MDTELTAQEIDVLLDRHRPDRYDTSDATWRDPVVTIVAHNMSSFRARQLAAKGLVDSREGQATRAANALLRKIGETKQWPLAWMEYAARPISVGGERICLRATIADDHRMWGIEEEHAANSDHASRLLAVDGARWIADQLDALGGVDLGTAMALRLGAVS